jgi:hypothetical protein
VLQSGVVTKGTSEQGRGVVERNTRPSPPTTLRGRWLIIARVAWVAVAVFTAGVFVIGIPSEFARLQTPCTGGLSCVWVPHLSAHNAQELGELGYATDLLAAYFVAVEVAFMVVSFAIGAAIFWRRSHDRMALLGSLMLITFGASLTVPYPLLDLPLLWKFSAEAVSFIGITLLILFIYLFPDGRFVPPWTRWLAALWIGLMVPVAFFAEPLHALLGNPWVNGLFATGLVGTTLFAQVYRYAWVSGPSQRQQTKWVLFGIVAALGGSCVLLLLAHIVQQRGLLSSMVGNTAWYLLMLLIPLSIAVAILRYHLYNIDVLINRTLVYGSLTALLAAVYFGGVAATQAIFRALTDQEQQPQLAIVVSTLVIAALLMPLRRRIQSFIDRRFYRSKYDARKTLEAFSTQLRDETDLDTLGDELMNAVQETMQPAHVSLWLRPDTTSKKREGYSDWT